MNNSECERGQSYNLENSRKLRGRPLGHCVLLFCLTQARVFRSVFFNKCVILWGGLVDYCSTVSESTLQNQVKVFMIFD